MLGVRPKRPQTGWSRALFRPSLIGRILMVLLIWGGVFFVLSVGVGWYTAQEALEHNARHQALDVATKLDELGTPLYTTAGGNGLLRGAFSSITDLVYVRYYSASGKELMAQYLRDDVQLKDLPPLSYAQLLQLGDITGDKPHLVAPFPASGSVVRMVSPIWIRSLSDDGLLAFDMEDVGEKVQLIGFMDYALDYSLYQQQLWQKIGQGGLLLALGFLISLLVARWVITNTLRPLAQLKEPLQRLADGEINQPLRSEELLELQPITRAMNHAIESLQDRDVELKRMASIDPLTGLLSRATFSSRLDAIVEQMGDCVLLFVDLDNFKAVNDRLGHAAGDRLLVEVAGLLTRSVPMEALVGRYGGDEFCVLLPNTDQTEGVDIAEAIIRAFRDYEFYLGAQDFKIYCSIGVAACREGGAEQLWSLADKACFKAKSLGRNRYHVSDSMDSQSQEQVRWAEMLRDALSHDRLEMLFQPVVDTRSQKLVQYELLLRLRHGEQLYPPSLFFPVAERLGMMLDIDRWVLERGLSSAASMAQERSGVSLRINLSAHIIEDDLLVPRLRETLKTAGLAPERLIFEVSESILMHNLATVVPVLEKLRALGCQLSVDNFAMGLRSFQTLKSLPISYLKLAGDFVDGWEQLDEVGCAMVKSIRELALASGQQLIADNLSSERDLQLLQKLGVPFAQGRFVGAPVGLQSANMASGSGEEIEQ
ncbi:EAL domain-containing protein [Aestuariirhabdus sp. Z084]|uniref:EAL domain-containing protein n=1 Tax=Aestuariirhabdus haliotis TaxID=2918751 RepID=UPI00201B3A7B|nr:EAL domain-containing protein [Aestuariirhabdus haliotis]MCL6415200.1 EAL domain-containing protein [Aestuariirhabdus haliotis]MCL6420075.1 EAL domain-containing protein [Aestuariirhabdus haliotis]